jgi:hypothetical protein
MSINDILTVSDLQELDALVALVEKLKKKRKKEIAVFETWLSSFQVYNLPELVQACASLCKLVQACTSLYKVRKVLDRFADASRKISLFLSFPLNLLVRGRDLTGLTSLPGHVPYVS